MGYLTEHSILPSAVPLRSNLRMHKASLCLLAALWFAASVPAQNQPAAAPAPEFKKLAGPMNLKAGDTVVFLGDSITHQCLYTQYVEDYFYTRYPNKRLRFHNAGVGGDRASSALARFDDDVASFKPKYVTILLGMNDGSYRDFDKAVFDTYQQDMNKLLDQLAAIGATAMPMTPTMHDARAARLRGKGAEPRDTYYNGVLALYGAWLREQSQVRGLGFVDMWSPLNSLTLQERKKDANFTLIKDAVHPDAPGQVVMATAVINDICPKTSVSSLTIAPGKDGKLTATGGNGKVTDFAADGDRITFTFTANALPWVLPPDAAEGYKLTAAGHRYSGEIFSARGLQPGNYELKIDGQSVGTWSEQTLGFKVELQANDKTPQYQQALKVALLNKEKNDTATRPLRNLWGQLKGKRSQLAQAASKQDPGLDAKKADFDKWFTGDFKTGVAKLNAAVDEFDARIYDAAKPLPRKYELVRSK